MISAEMVSTQETVEEVALAEATAITTTTNTNNTNTNNINTAAVSLVTDGAATDDLKSLIKSSKQQQQQQTQVQQPTTDENQQPEPVGEDQPMLEEDADVVNEMECGNELKNGHDDHKEQILKQLVNGAKLTNGNTNGTTIKRDTNDSQTDEPIKEEAVLVAEKLE